MRRIPYYRLPQASPEPKKAVEPIRQIEAKTVLPAKSHSSDTESFAAALPTFIPFMLIFALMRNRGTKTYSTQRNTTPQRGSNPFESSMDNTRTISLLNAVCPYLSEKEQVPIHTLVGFLHTVETIKSLQNRTYRIQGVSPKRSLSVRERQLGIVRAMKQFAQENERENLEKLERMLTTTDHIQNSMQRIQALRTRKEQISPSDQIIEVMNMIKPLLPQQHQQNVDKFAKVMKLMEIMDFSDVNAQEKREHEPRPAAEPEEEETKIPILPSDEDTENSPEDTPANNADQSSGAQGPTKEQQERIVNALRPLLNEEQQKSMDKLVELAQVLSRQMASESDNSNE